MRNQLALVLAMALMCAGCQDIPIVTRWQLEQNVRTQYFPDSTLTTLRVERVSRDWAIKNMNLPGTHPDDLTPKIRAA